MRDLISGNEAIFSGARKAGVSFYAAYPITPANEFISAASKLAMQDKNFRFFQAEDEIAAAMTVYGAWLAGRLAFTATSGPGFDLMQEALGWGYMARVPLVVVDVQRVGPATGMPTYVAQQDILSAWHGTHGDYQSLIFYPATVAECYTLTVKAFAAASALSQPVILLSDAILARTSVTLDLAKVKVKTPKYTAVPLGSTLARHWSGLVTDQKGVPRTASPEIYRKNFAARKKLFNKQADLYDGAYYQPGKKRDVLVISFGSLAAAVMDNIGTAGFLRPQRLWPLPGKLEKVAREYKRLLVVEANDGQYVKLIRQELIRPVESLAILGGRFDLGKIKKSLQAKLEK